MTPCHHRQVHSDPHRSLALCEGRRSPEAARTLPVIHGFPPFKPNLELSRARGPLPGAHCGLESLRHLGGLVGTLMQKTANETKRKKKEERKKTKRKEGRLTQSSRLPHTHGRTGKTLTSSRVARGCQMSHKQHRGHCPGRKGRPHAGGGRSEQDGAISAHDERAAIAPCLKSRKQSGK